MFRASLTGLAVATLAIGPVISSDTSAAAANSAAFAHVSASLRAAAAAPPRPGVTLPRAVDVQPRYSPQRTCAPVARPGTRLLGQLLVRHYGTGTVGYERRCRGGTSEHYDGRAVDWMVNVNNRAQKRAADTAVAWMSAKNGQIARRMGVQYIIWNARIWRAYSPERGWQAYKGASPHTDHVHISMTWDGANARTSWWSGRTVTTQDMTGSSRPAAPARPRASAPRRVAPAAVVTPITRHKGTALRGGNTGAPVSVLQRALGLRANSRFDARTVTAVKNLQKRWKLPVTGRVDTRTWNRVELTRYPWLPYVNERLQVGAKGPAVSALQRAMGMKATGVFDQRTAAVLRGTKKRLGLPATGITDISTWQAFTRL